jgi:3',5'-cyclic AMP phosphodiesterase CpdA
MFKVVQISDTHISETKAHFADNWPKLANWVRAQSPDLVIHTGDVTVDGADHERELEYCAGLMDELGSPWLAVPGNHDVGDAKNIHQPVNDARIARWNRHYRADRWVRDIPGWRLVGLNALLIGSDDPQERQQERWLGEVLDAAGSRRSAWFLHRPLFIEDPHEGDTGYWALKPAPRKRFLDLVDAHKVQLVASGHLHKSHRRDYASASYVWGPSSGFVVGPKEQPAMPGKAELGAVVYEFGQDRVAIRIESIPGLVPYVIDDVIHEVYPPRPAPQPALR